MDVLSAPSSTAFGELAALIAADLQVIVQRAASAICQQIPSYAAAAAEVYDDVAANTEQILLVVARCVDERRPPMLPDLQATAVHAGRRVEHGIELTDFLRAYRVSQASVWNSLMDLTRSRPHLQDATLIAAGILMETVEIASGIAGDRHLAESRLSEVEDRRAQRRLLETLIGGSWPAITAETELLRAFGLSPHGRVIVGIGSPARDTGIAVPRESIGAVRGALAADLSGLVVVRRDDVVGIVSVDSLSESAVVARVSSIVGSLSLRGLPVSAGISTVQQGLGSIALAMQEAELARSTLGRAAGVQCLSDLSTLDYLVLRPDPTAAGVIPARVRLFVEQDTTTGGISVEILEAYVASDMNAKAAATVLHVHVNAVYYRLERIAELTGMDLRRVADVLELLLAVRLLTPRPGRLSPDH